MSEAVLQREIIAALHQLGALVIRINSGRTRSLVLAPPGTPDLLAVLDDGRVLWVEVKTIGGRLRPAQTVMHAALARRGQQVIIARSVDDVTRALADDARHARHHTGGSDALL